MSRLQVLRALVSERLSAAAEEIFEVVETTLVELENEVFRHKEELCRQRRILDTKQETKLPRTDHPQRLTCTEEIVQEERDWSFWVDQETPEAPLVKEEHEVTPHATLGESSISSLSSPLMKREDEVKSYQNDSRNDFGPLLVNSVGHTNTEPAKGDGVTSSKPAGTRQAASDSEAAGDGTRLEPDSPGHETDDSDRWNEANETQPGGVNTSEWKWTKHESSYARGMTSSDVVLSRDRLSELSFPAPSCEVCGKQFANRISLKKHTHIHPSDCGLCGRHLEPPENLKHHLKSHLAQEISVRKKYGCAIEKVFSCPVCGQKFSQKRYVKVHIRSHTGEKPYGCTVCGQTFSRSGSLVNHKKLHTGVKPYSCPYCGKRFNHSTNLDAHIRTHTGEKPYICSGCGKGFCQASNLSRHRSQCHIMPSAEAETRIN